MTSTIPTDLTTLPLVDCAPWCHDGNGHTREIHPDDQYCMSAGATVHLTRERLLVMDENPVAHGLDFLRVYLTREHDARSPLVKMSHHDDPSVSLTLGEAEELGRALIEAAQMGAGA